MPYQTILFDIAAGVATITLNRPDKLNAFTARMHEELRDALAQIRADGSVRALLLTGAGRGFCAGQDLTEDMTAGASEDYDVSATLEQHYNPLVLALREALHASAGNTIEQQLALEAKLQREAGATADFREGVRAFREKRSARFSGR